MKEVSARHRPYHLSDALHEPSRSSELSLNNLERYWNGHRSRMTEEQQSAFLDDCTRLSAEPAIRESALLRTLTADVLLSPQTQELRREFASRARRLGWLHPADFISGLENEKGKVISSECLAYFISVVPTRGEERPKAEYVLQSMVEDFQFDGVESLITYVRACSEYRCTRRRGILGRVQDEIGKKAFQFTIAQTRELLHGWRLLSWPYHASAGRLLLHAADKLPAASLDDQLELLREAALNKIFVPPFLEACRTAIEPRVTQLPLSQRAEVFRAFGISHFDAPSLYSALSQSISNEREALSPKDVSLIAIGLAHLDSKDADLIEGLVRRVEEIGSKFVSREITPTISSLAVVVSSEQFDRLWNVFGCREDIPVDSPEGARLLCRAAKYHGKRWPEPFDRVLNRAFARYWQKRGLNRFEQDVLKKLRVPEYDVLENVTIEYADVDLFLKNQDVTIAVLCHGDKYHRIGYKASGPLAGFDRINLELLKRAGHGVILINLSEWELLPDSRSWLKERIKECESEVAHSRKEG